MSDSPRYCGKCDDYGREPEGDHHTDRCPYPTPPTCALHLNIEAGAAVGCDREPGHRGDHYDDDYEVFWMSAHERERS